MALTPVNIVVADEKWIFRNSICNFLLAWLIIICLSTSAIANGDFPPKKTENAPVYSLKDDSWIVNVPTVITLSPGIFFIPEVGYYDMDDADRQGAGRSVVCRRQVADRLLSRFITTPGQPEIGLSGTCDMCRRPNKQSERPPRRCAAGDVIGRSNQTRIRRG